MRALIFAGVEQVRYEAVPDPVLLTPQDAIVRVARAGICGSDLHIYHGRETGLDPGTVMGHEFAGEVVEVGRGVQRFRQGDRICSPFSISCGNCFFCNLGLTAPCQNGGTFFGGVQNGQRTTLTLCSAKCFAVDNGAVPSIVRGTTLRTPGCIHRVGQRELGSNGPGKDWWLDRRAKSFQRESGRPAARGFVSPGGNFAGRALRREPAGSNFSRTPGDR